jgi:hypothetical protein
MKKDQNIETGWAVYNELKTGVRDYWQLVEGVKRRLSKYNMTLVHELSREMLQNIVNYERYRKRS